jgi:hypothetical protein
MPSDTPSLEEQIAAIQLQIASLRLGFREDDGEVTRPEILHEIRCLNATVAILNDLRAGPEYGQG